MDYTFWKLTAGALCTLGLYSVLYRETKFYRFTEHIFLGLAAGWAMVALWTDVLKSSWWDKMVGTAASGDNVAQPGYFLWAFLLPIGIMAYFVFNKKHNWISRIPIGIIIGLWSGQQADAFLQKFGPQMQAASKPLIPNGFDPFFVASPPEAGHLYPSQAINNVIFLITLISVMSYFIFSIEFKNKFLIRLNTTGRWLMMIGFGAIFGTTVMTRFTLLIDRMYFIWIEWLIQGLFGGK